MADLDSFSEAAAQTGIRDLLLMVFFCLLNFLVVDASFLPNTFHLVGSIIVMFGFDEDISFSWLDYCDVWLLMKL